MPRPLRIPTLIRTGLLVRTASRLFPLSSFSSVSSHPGKAPCNRAYGRDNTPGKIRAPDRRLLRDLRSYSAPHQHRCAVANIRVDQFVRRWRKSQCARVAFTACARSSLESISVPSRSKINKSIYWRTLSVARTVTASANLPPVPLHAHAGGGDEIRIYVAEARLYRRIPQDSVR